MLAGVEGGAAAVAESCWPFLDALEPADRTETAPLESFEPKPIEDMEIRVESVILPTTGQQAAST